MTISLFDTATPVAPLRGAIEARIKEVLDRGAFVLGPEVEPYRGRKSLRLRGSESFFARVLESGRAYADRLAAQPDLSRRASTVVEDHLRWLDVAIEGLRRAQEPARAILRVE